MKRIAIHYLAVRVNDFLEQRMSKTHHCAAEQLRDRRLIMEHLPGIDRNGVLQNLKLTSVRIDFYFGDCCARRPVIHPGKGR